MSRSLTLLESLLKVVVIVVVVVGVKVKGFSRWFWLGWLSRIVGQKNPEKNRGPRLKFATARLLWVVSAGVVGRAGE